MLAVAKRRPGLDCVELPYGAGLAWPSLTYGSLVTVSG
jgi:hypothetical protein